MHGFLHMPQNLRPTFVGVDLGKTPLSAALAAVGHSADIPTLFLAGELGMFLLQVEFVELSGG